MQRHYSSRHWKDVDFAYILTKSYVYGDRTVVLMRHVSTQINATWATEYGVRNCFIHNQLSTFLQHHSEWNISVFRSKNNNRKTPLYVLVVYRDIIISVEILIIITRFTDPFVRQNKLTGHMFLYIWLSCTVGKNMLTMHCKCH